MNKKKFEMIKKARENKWIVKRQRFERESLEEVKEKREIAEEISKRQVKQKEPIKEKPEEEIIEEQQEAVQVKPAEEDVKRKEEIEKVTEPVEVENTEEIKSGEHKEASGKYVYCIIPGANKKISFGNIGIEDKSEVYTMNFGKIAAVVSDVPLKDYEKSENNIGVHYEAVKKVMEKFTVLPMSFGMVFKNEKILKNVLRKSKIEIKKALIALDGKVEMGLKVLTNGVSFDEGAFAGDIKTLKQLAFSVKLGKKFSKKLLLNVSYLVAKGSLEQFSEEVKKLEEKYPQLKILYSGPWAPYNFISINIGGG